MRTLQLLGLKQGEYLPGHTKMFLKAAVLTLTLTLTLALTLTLTLTLSNPNPNPNPNPNQGGRPRRAAHTARAQDPRRRAGDAGAVLPLPLTRTLACTPALTPSYPLPLTPVPTLSPTRRRSAA